MTSIHFTSGESWHPAPIDPAWIIDGVPCTEISPLGYHGSVSSGFWQCTAGRFTWHYGVTEAIYIIAGTVMIRDTRETIWNHLHPGDSVLFAKGSSAEWIVDRFVRKFYVIHERRSLIRRAREKLIRWKNSTKREEGK